MPSYDDYTNAEDWDWEAMLAQRASPFAQAGGAMDMGVGGAVMPTGAQPGAADLDLATYEQKMKRQRALADQLRAQGMGTESRRDWATQASQALAGIGGAYGELKHQKQLPELSRMRKDVASKEEARLRAQLDRERGPSADERGYKLYDPERGTDVFSAAWEDPNFWG